MKTGILILATHSTTGEMAVAERARDYLVSRGRSRVYIGCHHGNPDCYDVFLNMNRDGIDTYCILPLTVSEGNQTIWFMPKHLTLPDNSGSWTMIGNHDVATRFSTALGASPRVGMEMGRRLGVPVPGEGVIIALHGSALSFAGRTADYYADYLRYLGWDVETAFTVHGTPSMCDAESALAGRGNKSLRIIPLMISADSVSLKKELQHLTLGFTLEDAVSDYDAFYEVLDSKVPDNW